MPATTDELIKILNTQHSEVTAGLQKTGDDVRGLDARLCEIEQKAMRRGGGADVSAGGPSIGQQLTASDEYKGFIAGGMKGRAGLHVKAATLTTMSVNPLIAPDRRPDVVQLPRTRLTVRALLAPGTTASNLVEYPRQTGFTNNAGVVSEGTTKPESAITFELKSAPVRTIAHWIPVSRQAAQDAPQLQSLIDSEMLYGLALAEEDEMLNGDSTGEHLFGLIPQATPFNPPITVDAPNRLDILLMAIAQAQAAKLPATGIVMNDLDWLELLALKDGEGRYLGAGPFGAQPNVAWTLPVVGTPAMERGDFMAGAFLMAAQIFDHMTPQIFISDSHADFFIRNMLAVLCEERLALAVKRPEALVFGNFDAISG